MCRVGHGLSVAAPADTLDDGAVLLSVRVEEVEIDGLRTGKCARLPRRCISRVTSFKHKSQRTRFDCNKEAPDKRAS